MSDFVRVVTVVAVKAGIFLALWLTYRAGYNDAEQEFKRRERV